MGEAAALYRKIIKRSPSNIHALHSLGLIEAGSGNLSEAGRLMSRSLLLGPANIQFIENYATVLYRLGDYKTALEVSLKGCSIDHANKHLLYVSGSSFLRLDRREESLSQFDWLLLLEPNHLAALNERSIVLMEMKRYDAALDCIEKAILLEPQFADAHLNKGIACGQLERHDDAIAAFQKALALNPQLGNAWLGCGNSLLSQSRSDEALVAYDKALVLGADSDAVWLGRGNALFELRRLAEASESYDKALAHKPEWAEAWLGLGNVFRTLKDHERALSAYDKALAINPNSLNAESSRLNSKIRLCNWDNLSSEIAHFVESVKSNKDRAIHSHSSA